MGSSSSSRGCREVRPRRQSAVSRGDSRHEMAAHEDGQSEHTHCLNECVSECKLFAHLLSFGHVVGSWLCLYLLTLSLL